jgi:hypothetical protein
LPGSQLDERPGKRSVRQQLGCQCPPGTHYHGGVLSRVRIARRTGYKVGAATSRRGARPIWSIAVARHMWFRTRPRARSSMPSWRCVSATPRGAKRSSKRTSSASIQTCHGRRGARWPLFSVGTVDRAATYETHDAHVQAATCRGDGA